MHPLCFTARVWTLWEQANNSIPKASRCASHCHDCLPSYQLRMKKQRRCEHPEVMFSVDGEGAIHGVTSSQPRERKQVFPRSLRRMSPASPISNTVA